MFWNASNERDQIHTSQEHVFSVNNILKATGSLLFILIYLNSILSLSA